MNQTAIKLKSFLAWSMGTFLFLILIHMALPALFLILQIPSFALGSPSFWILRWTNDASGSGIQFNLLFLLGIAVVIGLILGWFRSRRNGCC